MGRHKEPKANRCLVGRNEFHQTAKPITVTLEHDGGKVQILMNVRNSENGCIAGSGSLGWYNGRDKVLIPINGKLQQCQVGFNLTVIGSKDAAQQRQNEDTLKGLKDEVKGFGSGGVIS
jgi:hypothetical protein